MWPHVNMNLGEKEQVHTHDMPSSDYNDRRPLKKLLVETVFILVLIGGTYVTILKIVNLVNFVRREKSLWDKTLWRIIIHFFANL